MKQYLLDFLKELEMQLAPPAKCHHSICYCRYGSNETGWEDKLGVFVNDGYVFETYFLDDEDFNKTPTELVEEIVRLHRERNEGIQTPTQA